MPKMGATVVNCPDSDQIKVAELLPGLIAFEKAALNLNPQMSMPGRTGITIHGCVGGVRSVGDRWNGHPPLAASGGSGRLNAATDPTEPGSGNQYAKGGTGLWPVMGGDGGVNYHGAASAAEKTGSKNKLKAEADAIKAIADFEHKGKKKEPKHNVTAKPGGMMTRDKLREYGRDHKPEHEEQADKPKRQRADGQASLAPGVGTGAHRSGVFLSKHGEQGGHSEQGGPAGHGPLGLGRGLDKESMVPANGLFAPPPPPSQMTSTGGSNQPGALAAKASNPPITTPAARSTRAAVLAGHGGVAAEPRSHARPRTWLPEPDAWRSQSAGSRFARLRRCPSCWHGIDAEVRGGENRRLLGYSCWQGRARYR